MADKATDGSIKILQDQLRALEARLYTASVGEAREIRTQIEQIRARLAGLEKFSQIGW